MSFDLGLDFYFDMLPLDLEMLLIVVFGEGEKAIGFKLIDKFCFLLFFELMNSLLLFLLWDLDFDRDLLVWM